MTDRHIASSPPPDDDEASQPIEFTLDYYERQPDDTDRGWHWNREKPSVLTLQCIPRDEVNGAWITRAAYSANDEQSALLAARDFLQQVLRPDSVAALNALLEGDDYIDPQGLRDLSLRVFQEYAGGFPTQRPGRSSSGPTSQRRTSAANSGSPD